MTQSNRFPSLFRLLRRAVTLAALVWLLLVTLVWAQTQVTLAPVPKLQFFDANGKPLAFGCVFSYQTLSSTPLATYTDYTGIIQNSNPIVLNSGGFVGNGGLWLAAGQAYRLVVKSAGGVNCAIGSTISTVDGIGGGTTTLTTIVPYSATPTFAAAAQNQLFEITLTGNATSQPLTAVGITPPAIFTWEITQDASGGHSFSWPANTVGGVTISSSANSVTQQTFVWNGTNAIALGPATYNFGGGSSAFGVTNLYDFGLSSNTPVCTGANGLLSSTCGSIFGVTYNGQTVSPGGSGNVNTGAAVHSLALNEGSGNAITGLLLSPDQVAIGKSSADPTGSSIPNCNDASGQHLNYASGGTFSCGTSINLSNFRIFSVTGCTPASSTDSQCTGTITVSPAFADASYFVVLTANNNGTAQNASLPVTVNGSLASNSIPYVISCTFFCSPVNTPTIYVFAFHP